MLFKIGFFCIFSLTSIAEEPNPSSANLDNNTDRENNTSPEIKACRTPRSAVDSLLNDINKNQIRCFEKEAHSQSALLIIAQRLAAVMRTRGVVLDIEKIPDDPLYVEPSKKHHRYYFSDRIKDIYLQKTNQGWLVTQPVIDNIEELYLKTQKMNLGKLYDFMPDWATIDVLDISGLNLAQIAILLILIVLGLIIRLIVSYLLTRHVNKVFVRLGMHEFEKLTKKASLSLGSLSMALFLGLFIPGLNFNVHIANYLFIAVRLGAGVSLIIFAYRSVDVFTYYLMQKALISDSKLYDQLVPIFRKGLKIVVLVVGVIFVLQNLNVDVTSLLAGVTIGGLAFSFAAKDTIANLFGSLTIFADKPFLVGDWIKAAGTEGFVESVGFRSTRIRTFYNSLVSIPNSKFTDSIVDNMGARLYRRTHTELAVAYDTTPEQIEAFCNGIRAILLAHPKTRKDYYEVHFSAYGDSALKIMLYFFLHVSSWSEELRARHEIYLDILRLSQKTGVRFAFPTQTIHIESMAQAEHIKHPQAPPSEELIKAAEYFSPQGSGVIPPGPRMGRSYCAHEEINGSA